MALRGGANGRGPCVAADTRARWQIMYKLRKELGEDDFRRIFGDPRVNGPKM